MTDYFVKVSDPEFALPDVVNAKILSGVVVPAVDAEAEARQAADLALAEDVATKADLVDGIVPDAQLPPIPSDGGDIGLGNVDNTSDANKPVSAAQQTALDLKAAKSTQDTVETGRLSAASLDATYVTLSGVLEAVPIYREGDSYDDGTQGADQASRPFVRLVSRFNMGTATKASVAGTRSDSVATRMLASFGSNRRGMVGIADGILNDVFQYGATTKEATTAEAFRTIFACASNRAVNAYSTGAFFFGPGWTAGASSTTGSYVDVAFTAAEGYLAIPFVTGAGGTLEVYDAGTLVRTVTTGGYAQSFTGVIRLTGSPSSAKTYRVVLSSGSASIASLLVSSPTPPLIVWDQCGPLGRSTGEDDRIALYNSTVEAVAADFDNVVTAVMGDDWDPDLMISGEDGIHRNDYGNAFATARIQEAILAALPANPTQGLNRIAATGNAGTYTIPSPAYSASGATAPSAPVAPTVVSADTTATVSWARPNDGGTTITGWSLQYRLNGAGSWTTFAGSIAASDISASLTGLTALTAYQTRIAAINAAGTGAYSTVTDFTTAATVTTISSDTFDRSDGALGSTPVGSFAWTVTGGTAAVSSNACVFSVITNASAGTSATVNDAASDGTFQTLKRSTGGGLLFNASSDTLTGYLVWPSGGFYTLSKRTGSTSYTTLVTSSAVPAAGDTITVVKNGSSIVVKINGTTAITTTDASYSGTRYGPWAQFVNTSYENISHTNALA